MKKVDEKSAITKNAFNKKIQATAKKLTSIFKKGVNSAEDVKAYWKEQINKIGIKSFDSLNSCENINGINPFITISFHENQEDFDDYDSVSSLFKKEDVMKFNAFADLYIEHKADQIAEDNLDRLCWDILLFNTPPIDEFTINTMTIYDLLQEHWKKFDREFLIDTVYFALLRALRNEVPMWIFKHKLGIEMQLTRFPKDVNDFPFPHYHIIRRSQQDRDLFFVISLDDMKAVVTKDDADFDMLFAVQLSLTQFKRMDDFLAYHLHNNFEGDITDFTRFLKALLFDYDTFLNPKHAKVIQDFIEANQKQRTSKKEESIAKIKRVWALKFLLETVVEHLDDKSALNDIAASKFIDIIIEGRDIADIKDSYTYRVMNNLYNNPNKLDTLDFIRELFVKMNLKSGRLLAKVDDKISLEKNRKNKSRI